MGEAAAGLQPPDPGQRRILQPDFLSPDLKPGIFCSVLIVK